VIQVTIVAIILVFIFWGVGGNQGDGPNSLATVNGEMVSYQEYQRLYDQKLNQLRSQLGGEIPPGLLDNLGLKEQILDELIQRMLLLQGANAAGVMVSEEEVRRAIQEMPAFQQDGVFDVDWYKQVLAGNRMNVTDFEASVQDDLLTAKILGHLSRFGSVSEAELQARFNLDYRQKKFAYVAFEAADFEKKVEINEEELAAFFESRRDNYLAQPEINLNYVLFPYGGTASYTITDEELTAYYEQRKDDYVVPETRRARHILVKVAEDAPQEEVDQARQRAEDLLQKARDNKDFAELALRNSDDKGSAAKGGDLGFFGRGQMVPPFEDAVFSLEQGGMTLVRSAFGFHVVKLEEIKTGRIKPLEEVRQEIAGKLRTEGARNQAFKAASEAYEKIILSGSLAKYAESGGADLKETGLFSRDQPPAVLKDEPAFLQAALGLKEGELSSIIDGTSAYAVFFAREVKRPQPPELAKVRKQVEIDFLKARSVELAREAAEKLLADLRNGGKLAEEVQGSGGKIQESPFISRMDRSGSRLDPSLLDAGLALTANKPVADQVEQVGQIFYVLVYQDEKEPPAELFQLKRDELAMRLAEENRVELLSAWVANLRAKADIVISPSFN
jgi:peptidyl-prolyl cis-trans isomerase D